MTPEVVSMAKLSSTSIKVTPFLYLLEGNCGLLSDLHYIRSDDM